MPDTFVLETTTPDVLSDANHSNLSGGTLHAAATTSVAGFMLAADKTKLDGVASGAAALTASAPVNVTKAAAVVGVATDAARADHKHDVTTAAPAATGVATSSGEGTATTLARSDHSHQSNTVPVNVTKAAAVIGTSGEPARADHKHDVTTAAPAVTGVATASGEGSATTLARSDHTHQSNTTPNTVGTANTIGTAGEPARADHVHDHGAQTSGTLHAVATTSVAGFMSAADKTKLNLVPTGGGYLQSGIAQPTADVSTTSASFVDMTGITVTLTTGANFVMIWFSALFSTSSAGAVADFRLMVDGVSQGGGSMKPGGSSGLIASMVRRVTVTAASHTIKIQWRTSAGTVSCLPTTNPDTAHNTLIVAEVSS